MFLSAKTLQSLRSTALSSAFGDAPLGKLSGASVRMEAPREARSLWSKITCQAKSLADRAALALGPAAPRAEAEMVATTKAFSAHLGDALGALSDTGQELQNEAEAQVALLALVKDEEELTRHGIGFDDALDKRINMHLEQLDRTQLTALVKGTHSAPVTTMIGDTKTQKQVVLALGMIANRAAERLARMVERDIRGYLQTGLANVIAQGNANNQEQFAQ